MTRKIDWYQVICMECRYSALQSYSVDARRSSWQHQIETGHAVSVIPKS